MASWIRLSYHRRLFVGLLAYSWLLLLLMGSFQYYREKQFKADELNAQLQIVNDEILASFDPLHPEQALELASAHRFENLRISIIDTLGRVLYDSYSAPLPPSDHSDREEVREAMLRGEGYAVRRQSQSTGDVYFYSAKWSGQVVVRSAVPYSGALDVLLSADFTFLWFMAWITLLVCILGFFVTRGLGRHIQRLNSFAERAERGEQISVSEDMPDDELGSISDHIVRLYIKLQQTTAERDREHRLALLAEQEKIRIKKQLTNNINHELKTPIASIKVCLETLLHHRQLSEEKRIDFLSRSYAACQRLGDLLDDVSTITRLEDGGKQIGQEDVNLSSLVSELCQEYEELAGRRGVRLINSVSFDAPIRGNYFLLSSVFRNLIDNGLAYSGGSYIKIREEVRESGWIRISVEDNGCGVSEEYLPHLFERFYRVDKGRSRHAGGTGLGLAIVKNAVQWHGGTISVANNAEGGLTFSLVLPMG